jgi:hypothetical protein
MADFGEYVGLTGACLESLWNALFFFLSSLHTAKEFEDVISEHRSEASHCSLNFVIYYLMSLCLLLLDVPSNFQ